MTKVYKITYYDEYEHPDDIEIVKDGSLVKYVKNMISEGRISDEELTHRELKTEIDAVEILESDGYYVSAITLYE